MDQKYLAKIKERCERALRDEYPEHVYGSAAYYLIATDIPALLAEVERQNQQIATLKRALILMGNDLADWMGNGTGEFWAKDYTAQAQGQEGKIG